MHFNVDGLVHTLFPEFQAQHFRKILRFYSRASVTAAVIDSSDSPAMQEEIIGPILPSLLRSGSFQAINTSGIRLPLKCPSMKMGRMYFLAE